MFSYFILWPWLFFLTKGGPWSNTPSPHKFVTLIIVHQMLCNAFVRLIHATSPTSCCAICVSNWNKLKSGGTWMRLNYPWHHQPQQQQLLQQYQQQQYEQRKNYCRSISCSVSNFTNSTTQTAAPLQTHHQHQQEKQQQQQHHQLRMDRLAPQHALITCTVEESRTGTNPNLNCCHSTHSQNETEDAGTIPQWTLRLPHDQGRKDNNCSLYKCSIRS